MPLGPCRCADREAPGCACADLGPRGSRGGERRRARHRRLARSARASRRSNQRRRHRLLAQRPKRGEDPLGRRGGDRGEGDAGGVALRPGASNHERGQRTAPRRARQRVGIPSASQRRLERRRAPRAPAGDTVRIDKPRFGGAGAPASPPPCATTDGAAGSEPASHKQPGQPRARNDIAKLPPGQLSAGERLNRTPMRRQNVSTVGDIPRTKGAVPRVAQAAVAAAPGHPRARTRVLPRG